MGTHLAASQKPRAQAKPGWPAVLTGLASKAPAQPCDILAGRLCCASPGTKRRGGDCWQGAGRAREAFPPAPEVRAVSTRHSTLAPQQYEEGGRAQLGGYLISTSPGGLWGTSQERYRHICRSMS